jgi:uncharacterized protein YkwD
MAAMRLRACLFAVAVLGCAALPWSAAEEKKEQPTMAKEVQLLVDLTNQARAKEKLPPLKSNDTLAKAASAFSVIMIEHDKKAREMMDKLDPKVHELGGKNVDKRLDDFNYDWTACGENVAIALRTDHYRTIFDVWMKSKVHRDNILGRDYEEMGIGIVKHPQKQEWYVTQIFGTQQKK